MGLEVAEFLSAKIFQARRNLLQCSRTRADHARSRRFGSPQPKSSLYKNLNPVAADNMAAGGAKAGLAHRSKSTPKKTESKTLKRKRDQEDLGKLRQAVEELVSALRWSLHLLSHVLISEILQ